MLWLVGLVALLGLWVVVLRRRVGDLNEAVRQQLERQVAQDERYADLTACVSDAVYALDLEGRFTAVNLAAERIAGRPRAEILRGSIFDLVVPALRDDARAHLAQAVAAAGRVDLRFQTTIAAADGRPVAIAGQLRLVTQQGLPVGFEGVAQAIAAPAEAETARPGAAGQPERQLAV